MVPLSAYNNIVGEPYSNDIDKIVFTKCVQDGVDGVFGNGQFQAFHTSTDINNNDDVLWWGGSLNVPTKCQWQRKKISVSGFTVTQHETVIAILYYKSSGFTLYSKLLPFNNIKLTK